MEGEGDINCVIKNISSLVHHLGKVESDRGARSSH